MTTTTHEPPPDLKSMYSSGTRSLGYHQNVEGATFPPPHLLDGNGDYADSLGWEGNGFLFTNNIARFKATSLEVTSESVARLNLDGVRFNRFLALMRSLGLRFQKVDSRYTFRILLNVETIDRKNRDATRYREVIAFARAIRLIPFVDLCCSTDYFATTEVGRHSNVARVIWAAMQYGFSVQGEYDFEDDPNVTLRAYDNGLILYFEGKDGLRYGILNQYSSSKILLDDWSTYVDGLYEFISKL